MPPSAWSLLENTLSLEIVFPVWIHKQDIVKCDWFSDSLEKTSGEAF